MLKEFDLIIAQLEHLLAQQKLSLQRMVFLLQPTKITLRCIDHLINRIYDKIGGCLLDRLHSGLLEQGDEKSRQIYEHLLRSATRPFIRMLSQWLYEGILIDPHQEFFIKEEKTLAREALEEDFNAHYWQDRYKLNNENIPQVLSNEAQKILITGKYLNVIRDCCPDMKSSTPNDSDSTSEHLITFIMNKDLQFSLVRRELNYNLNSSESLIEAINEAYQFSSTTFLKLLEGKYNLYSHLKSLRRFFLLENGDFFVQFMDTAEEELRKEAKEISIQRIQSLLLLSIHTSTISNDLNKDELGCILASHNLIQHLHLIQTAGEGSSSIGLNPLESFSVLGGQGLKGIEALTLEYKVGWPLSIVLSKRAITKYQLLSRLLFFCKHVELRLLECWKDHQSIKEMNLRHVMGSSYCLRHRMLHFLQNFVYYMTIEVFTPRSHEMIEAINKATNIDDVIILHEYFLDICLKECLLASQDLLRILTKITTTCLLFAEQMKRFALSNEINNTEVYQTITSHQQHSTSSTSAKNKANKLRETKLRIQEDFITREVTHDAYIRTLATFSDTFDLQLGEFLEKLWTDSYR